MYSNTELYCSNIKQISTIPRQDSQHEITMTPLGEMEQNNEQSNEQSKNMTRTNKNEQINASSESLGILSFIKNLFNKKLNCVLRNHVIYSGPVPSVIQDDLVLFIQCTQYTVYINLHLKRYNRLLHFETKNQCYL